MFRIISEPAEVLVRVDEVRAMADGAKKQLGFLPASIYEDHAVRGLLWAVIDSETSNLVGYLLLGGKYPALKVFQLNIKSEYQKQGAGELLIEHLKQFGIANHYLYISARVAMELEANKFWQKNGLQVVRQIPADGNRRTLNVYVYELPTALFISQKVGISDFHYKNATQLRNNRYVLDLNVYFDVVKNRLFANDAREVFRLGLSGRLKLAITEEFHKELLRNTPESGPDPLLELARAIPKWPDAPKSEKKKLVESLRADIFPDRSLTRRSAIQDQSDLTHLAISLHHGADGFVTRENAILKKSAVLRDKYGLDVISPTELIQSDVLAEVPAEYTNIGVGSRSLSVGEMRESDRQTIAAFLTQLGIESHVSADALSPGHSENAKPRIVAKVDQDVCGFLTYSQAALDGSVKALMYVNEHVLESERVIDHFYQAIEAMQRPRRLAFISLGLSAKQYHSYETGLARGYRRDSEVTATTGLSIGKWCYRGPLLSNEWSDFRNAFVKQTGLELPLKVPSFSELSNTGVFIRNIVDKQQYTVPLREFETMTSTFLIAHKRPIVIIPIKIGYARRLLGAINRQRDFDFRQPEAVMRSEKAYFSRSGGSKQLVAGALVLFYVSASNGGNKAIVGMARITSSRRMTVAAAVTSLGRQGVLDTTDIEDISNQNDEVMAVTFDNYFSFPREVSWSVLKEMGCVGAANLVTAQSIEKIELDRIIPVAYGE